MGGGGGGGGGRRPSKKTDFEMTCCGIVCIGDFFTHF